MNNRILIRLAVAAALLIAAAVPARAQIYTWRDANGNLVLSDHPRDGVVVKTFAVPKADSLRVTRFVRVESRRRLRRPHRRTCPAERRASVAGASGRSGRIRLQSVGRLTQGRARPDAIDAGNRAAVPRRQSVQSDRERAGRCRLSQGAAGSLQRQGRARARGLQRRAWSGRPLSA